MARETTTAPRRFGTVEDGAALLRVDKQTIRRKIAAGELTGFRIGKRTLRVDLDEVEALARPIPTAAAAAS